jgi:hypothetical protein
MKHVVTLALEQTVKQRWITAIAEQRNTWGVAWRND